MKSFVSKKLLLAAFLAVLGIWFSFEHPALRAFLYPALRASIAVSGNAHQPNAFVFWLVLTAQWVVFGLTVALVVSKVVLLLRRSA